MARPNDATLLQALETLALKAGTEIMRFFPTQVSATIKADGSPVTAADLCAEALILEGLRQQFPEIPCIAEEEIARGDALRDPGPTFFLVDALDGTKEFLHSREEFTVNIALVRDGVPVLGVVYAPAKHTLYTGLLATGLAHRRLIAPDGSDSPAIALHAKPVPATQPTIVASRSHRTADTNAFIDAHPGAEVKAVGSSLKFCLIASGEADLYPCFGRTMEWDTAAGQAVLLAAGGQVRLPDGAPLRYGKRFQEDADFANPWFIASGVSRVQ